MPAWFPVKLVVGILAVCYVCRALDKTTARGILTDAKSRGVYFYAPLAPFGSWKQICTEIEGPS